MSLYTVYHYGKPLARVIARNRFDALRQVIEEREESMPAVPLVDGWEARLEFLGPLDWL